MSIQHTVVFALLHPVGSPESVAFLADARRILTAIPGVEQFTIHAQVSAKSDFTHQFSMMFASNDVYESYNEHPAHVAFVAERWDPEVDRFQEYDFVLV